MSAGRNLSIDQISAGPFLTNTYLISSGGEAIMIDPGTSSTEVLQSLPIDGKKIVAIIATHGHFDHLMDIKDLKEAFGCGFMMGEGDEEVLKWSYSVSGRYMGKPLQEVGVGSYLKEGEYIRFGEHYATVVSLPGHTPGSIGLIVEGCFFTGDTLFKGSIGRTDLGGSMKMMSETLERIKKMDQKLKVFPGHGPGTTISNEIRDNPFLS